jgi:hypothetical protein
MSDAFYIAAAYGLTWVVLAGYALRLAALRRRAERALVREGGAQ